MSAPRSAVYGCYGLRLATTYTFRNRLPAAEGPPDVSFEYDVEPLGARSAADRIHPPPERPGTDITLWADGPRRVLRFADLSEFLLEPGRIRCRLRRAEHAWLLEIQLLGMVLSLYLELAGVPTLHASAVAAGDAAIAFVGAQGAGKTSMAATFLEGGWELLTEDLLALEESGTGVLGHPGYPQMRMWPDQAQHFAGNVDVLEVAHPAFTKRRVPVAPSAFSREARPLASIYVLERQPPAGSQEVQILAVPPAEAAIELVRHSFLPDAVHAAGLQPARLAAFARILGRLPVRRVRYPDGMAALPTVRAALVDDLRSA
ncbi:MAG: hypothetical protein ACR2KP_18835 [Egibacteraceae bacterium]